MPATTRLGLHYPALLDIADVPADLSTLAQQLDAVVTSFGMGTLGTRPVSTPSTPGVAGRVYLATDQSPMVFYVDYGTGWVAVGSIAAGSIGTLQLADRSVTEIKLAAPSVGTIEVFDGAITGQKIADLTIEASKLGTDLKPSQGAGASVEALRALGAGPGLALNISDLVNLNRAGLRSARPAANSVPIGTKYFATDQLSEYRSDGSSWSRIGIQAGDIFMTLDSVAAAGRVLLQGQSWPATNGPYADLYAKWGGVALPDMQGRVPVGFSPGGKAEVNALRNNDGRPALQRSPSHIHYHDGGGGRSAPDGVFGGDYPSGFGGSMRTSGDVNNLNSPAYYVVNYEAQL